MLNLLHENGLFSLSDASMAIVGRTRRSEWKTAGMLELDGVNVDIWEDYVISLKSNFILLK